VLDNPRSVRSFDTSSQGSKALPPVLLKVWKQISESFLLDQVNGDMERQQREAKYGKHRGGDQSQRLVVDKQKRSQQPLLWVSSPEAP
jgi:hypothetical protein